MTALLAEVTVKPGMETHWEGIARTVWGATHENEPGCLRYEYWRGSKPRHYFVLLIFEDFDSFMVHQVADYHHNAGFGDCFESFSLQHIDPVTNACGFEPSETASEPNPKKGEIWNNYVANHSEPTPEWWLEHR